MGQENFLNDFAASLSGHPQIPTVQKTAFQAGIQAKKFPDKPDCQLNANDCQL
jgi:hypothetical protein